VRQHGKLRNAVGELIAEGPCELDSERQEVTMWPERELSVLDRYRGALSLELETGTILELSEKRMIFKMGMPGNGRTSMYRLNLLEKQPFQGFPAARVET
jgi:hypothetical protein